MSILLLHTFGLLNIQSASAASHITHVLVYEDRAEITRKQESTCVSGIANLMFTNIPNTVDEKSIRATTKSSSTNVIGVTSSMVSYEAESNEEEIQIKKRQKKFKKQSSTKKWLSKTFKHKNHN